MVIPRRLASLALPVALAGVLTGCYEDNCELRGTCPVLDMVPLDSLDVDCDPASELATDGCGVFVSAQGSDEDGTGTRYVPVRTINRALQIATTGHRTVYACAEVFPDPVVMVANYRVFGGFDCARDWEPIGLEKKTHVRVGPGLSALQVLPGDGVAEIKDVAFEATDAMEPSGSSVAAILEDGANVWLERCDFIAGDGASGLDGLDGTFGSPFAKSGPNGLAGMNACLADGPQGGELVQVECDDGVWTMGGLGGPGGLESGGAGTDGAPVPSQNPSGFGLSGLGESGDEGCTAGVHGADGVSGLHGLGGEGPGFLHAAGYMGRNGQDGAHGRPGQGGGGGGGARGGVAFCGNKPKGGAAGGSGGAGGCGGRPGRGGTYGGASIGLAISDATVHLVSVRISTGNGGRGGSGGVFQHGGLGGFQGLGGHGWGGSSTACAGGAGGRGGKGGYGGGASGGPSVGIAHTTEIGTQDFSIIHQGLGGHGGHGGNPNWKDMGGDDGLTAPAGWLIAM